MINTIIKPKGDVLILGCGWVGEALAIRLLGLGYRIWATTRLEEKMERLQKMGISAVAVDFDNSIVKLTLPSSVDFVLNSIPANQRDSEQQIAKRFNNLHRVLKTVSYRKQIFLSSVGIYPDKDGIFEESHEGSLSPKLALAEQFVRKMDDVILYRLGGLFGLERVFAKYFVERTCTTGNQPANFVHLEDVLQLIQIGFEEPLVHSCYNIVAPDHPSKEEVIYASAAKYGFKLPIAFDPKDDSQKVVSGERIMKELNYNFVYPSPLSF